MSTHTLADVREAIAAGRKTYFGALKVYVTGFQADLDFPRKFVYRGCTEDNGHGFQCCKSLERGRCTDHPTGNSWVYMFRFDLFLVDSTISPTSPPLRVTIFNAAASLLQCSPSEFLAHTEISQFELVHAATHKLHMIYVYVGVNPGKDNFPIVENVWMDKPRLPTPSPRGRALSLCSPGQVGASGGARILSRVKPSVEEQSESSQNSISKDETVRKLLFELVDLLGQTKLQDQ